LSEGRGLTLRYTTPTTGSPLANALRSAPTPPNEARVDARGFAAAVDASVKIAN
jgi:hypothetical protein